MEIDARRALEAILFVVDEPVDLSTLSQVLELDHRQVRSTLEDLATAYEQEQRGFVLREVAGGWRMYTAPEAAPYVERWVVAGKTGRLTQAALETLAVIAYKQPISRHEIGEIRGVNPDGAVRTLTQRGLVEEVARDEGPGQAILYGTSSLFLEKLGLNDIEQLPPLAEYLPESPAPDEPGPGDVKAARRHLASGEDLPSTGRARWQGSHGAGTGEPHDAGDAGDDAAEHRSDDGGPLADAAAAAREAAEARRAADLERRRARREQDEQMADLTAALDAATSSALEQLRSAVEATEDLDAEGEATERPQDGSDAPSDVPEVATDAETSAGGEA